MRFFSLLLCCLVPLAAFADPIEDMLEMDAFALKDRFLTNTYILDYCDCCGNSATLIWVDSVTLEPCSYNADMFSLRIHGRNVAAWTVENHVLTQPQRVPQREANGLISLNYHFVYAYNAGIPLGYAVSMANAICNLFVAFPSPAVMRPFDAGYEKWHTAMQENLPFMPKWLHGTWEAAEIWDEEARMRSEISEPKSLTIHADGTGLLTLAGAPTSVKWTISSESLKAADGAKVLTMPYFLRPDGDMWLYAPQAKGQSPVRIRFCRTSAYVIAGSGLRLRSAPSTTAPVIATIPFGTAVTRNITLTTASDTSIEVEGMTGKFIPINYQGKVGYAFEGFLCAEDPAKATPRTTAGILHCSMNLRKYSDISINSTPEEFNIYIDDLVSYSWDALHRFEEKGVKLEEVREELLVFQTAAGKRYAVNVNTYNGGIYIRFDGTNQPKVLLDIVVASDPEAIKGW